MQTIARVRFMVSTRILTGTREEWVDMPARVPSNQ